MSNNKFTINIVAVGEESIDRVPYVSDPVKRILLSLELTQAAWKIREARGDKVPRGLERTINIL